MGKKESRLYLAKLVSNKQNEFYLALSKDYLKFFTNKQHSSLHLSEMKELIRYKYSRDLVLSDVLTIQEAKCLFLAARGKNTEETAILLGLSINTVESYRRNLRKKLKSRSMTQAAMHGIKEN